VVNIEGKPIEKGINSTIDDHHYVQQLYNVNELADGNTLHFEFSLSIGDVWDHLIKSLVEEQQNKEKVNEEYKSK
jgi:hypothetical protein